MSAASQAPDPQLHSHVVITGAIREDDRIVAVASRPVFRAARELGAFYRSALAEELAHEGYGIEQNTGKGGKYFEIEGVPRELCEAFSGRSREVARAAERFRARYGRAPERGSCATSRSRTAPPRPSRLALIWNARGGTPGTSTPFGAERGRCGSSQFNDPQQHTRPVEDRIEGRLTEHKAIFEAKELRAVALEQTAGEMPPDQALTVAREMVRDRRILTWQGGHMTTLAIRAQEQAIERRAAQLAQPAGRDVGRRRPRERSQGSRRAHRRTTQPASNARP